MKAFRGTELSPVTNNDWMDYRSIDSEKVTGQFLWQGENNIMLTS